MVQLAKLRSFVSPEPREFEHALKNIAEAWARSGEKGIVQIRILEKPAEQAFVLKLSGKACTLESNKVERPNLELIVRPENLWKILEGSLSPLEAFLHGKLRVRGDVKFGCRLLRHIAASSEDQFDICHTGA